ncbi:TerD family protein [Streptomyces sp. CWNU-1]|uniref:TerD family protein n=1 Tax=Streptomyces albipurpureus TaxID=2897419 RepID=A0ABT0UR84_9ACTN|nr:TerD family protein [Streptomyces sp. CWNU-1]
MRYLGANDRGPWLELRLAVIEAEIERVLVVASRDGIPFSARTGLVMEAFAEDGEGVLRYEVDDAAAGTALVLGAFHRSSGGWKFSATGEGYASGLAGLVSAHGIEVADDPAAPAPATPLAAAPAAPPVPAPAAPVPHPTAPVGAHGPDTAASDWSFGEAFVPHVVAGHGREVVDTGRHVPAGSRPGPHRVHGRRVPLPSPARP